MCYPEKGALRAGSAGGAEWGDAKIGSGATATSGGKNTVSADYDMVCGGRLNTAAGQYSLAAGNQAKANHIGRFVWADQTAADFASTAVDQFLIRAAGGVGR